MASCERFNKYAKIMAEYKGSPGFVGDADHRRQAFPGGFLSMVANTFSEIYVDAGLLAAAQAVERYEISRYFADRLGGRTRS